MLKSDIENHFTQCYNTKPEHALGFGKEDHLVGRCEKCDLPLQVVEYLKEHIPSCHHQLISDCKEKIKLYLGHRVRVSNQRHNINKYLEKFLDHQAYLVMDFKNEIPEYVLS